MHDPLATYLHGHLAGSSFAIELLEKLASEFEDTESGAIASEILNQVHIDRQPLELLIARVGKNNIDFYDALGWMTERISRIKLRHDHPQDIGALEAFEAIGLGLLGKRGLWEALEMWRKSDERVAGFDYPSLMERAEQQFQQVDRYRLKLAQTALAPTVETAQ